MSLLSDNEQRETAPLQPETVAKKSHRIQTNIPAENVSSTEHGAETGARRLQCAKLCEMPQVGILEGTAAYEKTYNKPEDILKHLCVAYLFTVLKPPSKWTPETFADVLELECTNEQQKLMTTMRIYKDKMYVIHLSSTLMKGRFMSSAEPSTRPERPNVHDALAQIKRGKAAIWTCDTHYFLIRRVQEGFYFYGLNLQRRPELLFFMCHRWMINYVQETYGCTERSKYFLSHVMLHSVEDGDLVRIVWKMKRSVGMKLEGSREAILHGNIYLLRPSVERSLEICLNVLERVVDASHPLPRAWENRTLNGCFKRSPDTSMAAEKIAAFLCARNESSFSVGSYHIACRTTAVGHRQRKHFEELVSYFLASCTALLVVGLDCCFLLWSREDFIHWFSPYRYSSLQDNPKQAIHRASFLHMTNALAKSSQSLYEYLFELGLFPDHTVELFPLRVTERKRLSKSSASCGADDGDEDSLDQEGLTIAPGGERGWRSFYTPIGQSPSELRLARQVLEVVYQTAEERID